PRRHRGRPSLACLALGCHERRQHEQSRRQDGVLSRQPRRRPGLGRSAVINDAWLRPLRNLRLSVTDRCNLRCAYCMPEEEYAWLPRADILTFEETARLVDVFADLGVDKVRLTGGEPLLRKDPAHLVKMIAAEARLRALPSTTNGILRGQVAPALRAAG